MPEVLEASSQKAVAWDFIRKQNISFAYRDVVRVRVLSEAVLNSGFRLHNQQQSRLHCAYSRFQSIVAIESIMISNCFEMRSICSGAIAIVHFCRLIEKKGVRSLH